MHEKTQIIAILGITVLGGIAIVTGNSEIGAAAVGGIAGYITKTITG